MKDRFIELQNQQRDKIEAAKRGDVRNFNQIVSDEICTGQKVTYGVIRVEAGDTVGCGKFIANGLCYADARRLAELQPAVEGVVTIWVPDNYKQHLPKEEQRED